MNEKNLEALKKDLKFLGFGEGLQDQLTNHIQQQKPEFTLTHQAFYHDKTLDSTLHFRAGKENEMYFFNKYEAKLGDKQQTFYLDRGNGITTKEAFNLLEGRAVNKDLVNKEQVKYNAWIKLDFGNKEPNGNYKIQPYHENYGYDAMAALERYPIKELKDAKFRDELVKSLEKGNLQSVTVLEKTGEKRYLIQADPQFKDITLFAKDGNKLDREQAMALRKDAPKQEKKESAAISNHKKQSQTTADTVELKKKRQGNKKGMGL